MTSAVGEMDKVTQQNAASAEESSSAASELNGQAEELAAMVGAFQLERPGARAGASPLVRPVAHPPDRTKGLPAAGRPVPGAGKPGRPAAAFPMDDEAELREF